VLAVFVAALWATQSFAAPPALRVTQARLERDAPQSGDSGRMVIEAVIGTAEFAGMLLANTVLYDLVSDPYELDNRAHNPDYESEVATRYRPMGGWLS
jgi:hypothetical protein